jgi:hypothetical protein
MLMPPNHTLRVPSLAASTLLLAAAGHAAEQQVMGNPSTQAAASGSSFSVEAIYSVDDNNSQLTGLGLQIHWDSTKLTLVNVTGFEAVGFVATTTSCGADTNDEDNDPATDCKLLTAWAMPVGDWPGSSLPISLLTLDFTSNLGSEESTSVNFSTTSTAAGYSFAGSPAVINGSQVAVVCGDANGSGSADIVDALLIARYAAGLSQTLDLIAADVNGSGVVDIIDALLIARHTAGLSVPGT